MTVAPPAEAPRAAPPPAAGNGSAGPVSTLSLRLAPLLCPLSYEELGFAPERVPDRVRVELPAESLLKQLPSGRVTIPLAEVISHLSDRIRPAFQNARPGLELTVPLAEIFETLPGEQTATPAAPRIETLFSTPFAIKAAEDEAVTVPSSPPLPPPLEPLAKSAPSVSAEPRSPVPEAPMLPFVIVPDATTPATPAPKPASGGLNFEGRPASPPLPQSPSPLLTRRSIRSRARLAALSISGSESCGCRRSTKNRFQWNRSTRRKPRQNPSSRQRANSHLFPSRSGCCHLGCSRQTSRSASAFPGPPAASPALTDRTRVFALPPLVLPLRAGQWPRFPSQP